MSSRILNSISGKVLLCIIVVGIVVTVLFSSFSIFLELRDGKVKVEKRLEKISSTYVASITNSFWNLDYTQVKIDLDGIIQLDDIEYAEVREKKEIISRSGRKLDNNKLTRVYPLIHSVGGGKTEYIGDLYIQASLASIENRILKKAIFTFFVEFVRIVVFCFMIFVLIDLLLVRHLKVITRFLVSENNITNIKNLSLSRDSEILHVGEDEVDSLVFSINEMRKNLSLAFSSRIVAQNKLEALNESLEREVEERTSQLVKSKELAVIGEMSASVAHEINSPLSVVFLSAKRMLKKIKMNEEVDRENIRKLVEIQISTLSRIFMITEGLNILSSSSSLCDEEIVNLVVELEEIKIHLNNVLEGRGVPIVFELFECNRSIKLEKNKITQLLYSISSFRTNALSGKESSWLKFSFKLTEEDFFITVSDSIGYLTDSQVELLREPFGVKAGIEKGSNLELSSIKPLVDRISATINLNIEKKNQLMEIKISLSKK